MNTRPLLLSLALTLSAAAALSQEASDERAAATGSPENGAAAAAPGDSAAPAPGGEESPFDYEASEQISEDLSVSFPVDI